MKIFKLCLLSFLILILITGCSKNIESSKEYKEYLKTMNSYIKDLDVCSNFDIKYNADENQIEYHLVYSSDEVMKFLLDTDVFTEHLYSTQALERVLEDYINEETSFKKIEPDLNVKVFIYSGDKLIYSCDNGEFIPAE